MRGRRVMPDDVCVGALGGTFRLTVMREASAWRATAVNSPIMYKSRRSGADCPVFHGFAAALRLTLPQAAQYMRVHPEIIEVLETGQVEICRRGRRRRRSSWTTRPSPASTDVPCSQPSVVSLSRFSSRMSRRQCNGEDHAVQAGGHFVRAGSAIANGARRLPKDAMHQIRERPQRALYALSLPLFVLLFFHASIFDGIVTAFQRRGELCQRLLSRAFFPDSGWFSLDRGQRSPVAARRQIADCGRFVLDARQLSAAGH